MGILYECKCPSCQYEEQFAVGGGRNDWNEKNALMVFPEDAQEKIKNFINAHDNARCLINRKIAKGVSGGEEVLTLATEIKVVEGDKELQTFVNYRDSLEGPVREYNEDELLAEKISCPKCNGADLEFKMTGFWD